MTNNNAAPTGTATLVRADLEEFRGTANLYRVEPSLGLYDHVIVSAIPTTATDDISAILGVFNGPAETVVLGAYGNGEVAEFRPVSEAGYLVGVNDIPAALAAVGYTIAEEA